MAQGLPSSSNYKFPFYPESEGVWFLPKSADLGTEEITSQLNNQTRQVRTDSRKFQKRPKPWPQVLGKNYKAESLMPISLTRPGSLNLGMSHWKLEMTSVEWRYLPLREERGVPLGVG